MAAETFTSGMLPLVCGLLLSFSVERLLRPQPLQIWQRPLQGLLHCAVWLTMYAPLLILLRRPWFTNALLLALLLLVVQISNAKQRALREPFIYQDFSYFIDALRFPRLYLPFLGFWSAVAVATAVAAALVCGLLLEAPMPFSAVSISTALSAGTGLLLFMAGRRAESRLELEPNSDLVRMGMPAMLIAYAVEERKGWRGDWHSGLAAPPPRVAETPNMVVVQSESFFDPRRWLDGIGPELLQGYDSIRAEALQHGTLQVPAWGANTVRTEFSFLSGQANHLLGVHSFKPYRILARQGVPTLAGYLKQLGYRTVCLHPYSSTFYDRHQVFPLLGFDEFIDMSRFSSADYNGQYIGDAAVAREACRELSRHDSKVAQPLFLFIITMENHGPVHLEKPSPEDRWRFYTDSSLADCDQLTVYLRHLEQADRMTVQICDHLKGMESGALFCLYGDHLPIIPVVFDRYGTPDGAVDYLIWDSRNTDGQTLPQELKVEDLAWRLVESARLAG